MPKMELLLFFVLNNQEDKARLKRCAAIKINIVILVEES